MLRSTCYALVISLISMSEVSAQTARPPLDEMANLGAGRRITVVDDSGANTNGTLVRFTPDALTLAVKGQDVVFDRQQVTAVFERGDSLMNGMLIGLVPGVVALAAAGDDDYAQAGSIVLMAIGLGVGTVVDALIKGRRPVYGTQTRGDKTTELQDFGTLVKGRAVIVVDDSGRETHGRMLRLTADALTMTVDGRDRTLARQKVSAIFEQGDSVKNGMRNGFLAGAVVGIAAGVSKTQCGRDPVGIGFIQVSSRYELCTSGERITRGLGVGTLMGGIGVGLGAAVDALIPGRRLVYEKAKRANAPAISLLPTFAPASTGLQMRMSW